MQHSSLRFAAQLNLGREPKSSLMTPICFAFFPRSHTICTSHLILAKASHGLPILDTIQLIETIRLWFV
jgi:hypothetical protein